MVLINCAVCGGVDSIQKCSMLYTWNDLSVYVLKGQQCCKFKISDGAHLEMERFLNVN